MVGYREKVALLFQSARGKRNGTLVAVLYFFLFLFALGNVLIAGSDRKLTYEDTPVLQILSDWPEKIFKEMRPFNYEAIGAFYLTPQMGILISPMNMLLAAVLSALVGLNILAVVFGWEQPKLCQYKGRGLLLSLSALLTGFSCCVPTFLLLLGSSLAVFTVGAIAAISLFYPVSVVGLAAGFFFSVKRIRIA